MGSNYNPPGGGGVTWPLISPDNAIAIDGNYDGTLTNLNADGSASFAGGGVVVDQLAAALLQVYLGSIQIDAPSGTDATAIPDFRAIIGHVVGNSGFDGTGFAFGNSGVGTNTIGLVVNGETAFFGSPTTGNTFLIVSNDGTYDTQAVGSVGVNNITINNSISALGNTYFPHDVAGTLTFSNP